MVPGLLRAVSRRSKNEPARTDQRRAARLSRRELEIPLQQSARNCPRLKRAELLVQRSWLSRRVRVRVRIIPNEWPIFLSEAFPDLTPRNKTRTRRGRTCVFP